MTRVLGSVAPLLERLLRQTPRTRPAAVRYTVAVVSVLTAAGVKLLVGPYTDEPGPLVLFALPIVISAFYGGFGPGMVATLVGAALTDFLFLGDTGSFALTRGEIVHRALFIFEGGVISLLAAAFWHSVYNLSAAHDQLRAILTSVADGIMVQNASGEVVFANAAAARVIGFEAAERLLATPALEVTEAFDLLDEHGRPLPHDQLPGRRALDGKDELEAALRFRVRGTGEERWSVVRAALIRDDRGRPVLAVSAFQDITAIKQAERELEQLLEHEHAARTEAEEARARVELLAEEVKRASEAKDEFLGIISHEIRTPVTTLFLAGRLLAERGEEIDSAARASVVTDIQKESERLLRVIEDLLMLARMEAGRDAPEPEPVLAQHLIESQVDAFRRRAPERPVSVYADRSLLPVAAVPTYVEQVLRNLLANADKYSPPGAPIEIHATRNGTAEAAISVLDRGTGIDPADAERIFERFYRAPSSSGVAGAGMGLTVCRRLIEAQGGRIWAEPREGGGLVISFVLPISERP